MTIAERNNKLKHFIACLKCKVSGKSCDVNCSVQYDAGNMRDIIENLEAISKVIEQEQYYKDLAESYEHTITNLTRALADRKCIVNNIYGDIQRLRGCSCSCSDGIIDNVEDIVDKYNGGDSD